MNHLELVELRKKHGEKESLIYCSWCFRPFPKHSISRFLGFNMCSACRKRFLKMMHEINQDDFLKWMQKNLPFDIKVKIEGDLTNISFSVKNSE